MWGASPPEALLPCPCSWTSTSHCACPQTQTLPHGAHEEAAALGGAALVKVHTCPSAGAQQLRELVTVSGDPLGNVDPLHVQLSLSLWLSSLRGEGRCFYVEPKQPTWCSASFFLFLWGMCLHQTWWGAQSGEKRLSFLFDLRLLTQHLWSESSRETGSCSP